MKHDIPYECPKNLKKKLQNLGKILQKYIISRLCWPRNRRFFILLVMVRMRKKIWTIFTCIWRIVLTSFTNLLSRSCKIYSNPISPKFKHRSNFISNLLALNAIQIEITNFKGFEVAKVNKSYKYSVKRDMYGSANLKPNSTLNNNVNITVINLNTDYLRTNPNLVK